MPSSGASGAYLLEVESPQRTVKMIERTDRKRKAKDNKRMGNEKQNNRKGIESFLSDPFAILLGFGFFTSGSKSQRV